MSNERYYDLSGIVPRKRQEVLRRIEIIETYLGGTISSTEAMRRLGVSAPTFWRLLRAWRQSQRPADLGATGHVFKARMPIDEDAEVLIQEAEQLLPGASIRRVVHNVQMLAQQRGVQVPYRRKIEALVQEARRARGLRPEGIVDLVLEFCALDVAVVHPEHGLVAPVMCALLDVRKGATFLGMTLSFDAGSSSQAARTILDAVARADRPRSAPVRSFTIPNEASSGWPELGAALAGAGLPLSLETVRPRASARSLVRLLGKRPAGVVLLPDLTRRRPSERLVKLKFGDPIELPDAEDMLRERFRNFFPGDVEFLCNDAAARSRLTAALQRLA